MDIEKLKRTIAQTVKKARLERKFTQRELSKLLRITQARLSQIENGKGSFTAEQLIILMQRLNLPLSYFVGEKTGDEEILADKLQKSLSRLGADSLHEAFDVLPYEKLQEIEKLITDTIVMAYSTRTIVALAPVIVKNIHLINFNAMINSVNQVGLLNRLGWILESVSAAINIDLQNVIPKKKMLLYKRAVTKIGLITSEIERIRRLHVESASTEDLLDKSISSSKTLDAVIKSRTRLAEKWKIITRISTEDFHKALAEARID